MNTLTLPHVAADLDGTGHAWYAAAWDGLIDDETNVIWLAEPHLIPGHHWAEDKQVRSPHITLDMVTIAELIAHDITADPDTLSDDEVLAVIDAQLLAVSCDMCRCCVEVLAEQADHYDGGRRISRALLRAGRLLEVSV